MNKQLINDHLQSIDLITNELLQLDRDNIKYDYRKIGSKNQALIKLDNGKTILFCPYRKNAKYLNKLYKIKKSLKTWMAHNNLHQIEVK